MTRNGMSAQVKALSMIIAIEGLIPDRRAVSAPEQTRPARKPAILCLRMDAYPAERGIRGPPAAPRKKPPQNHNPLSLLTPLQQKNCHHPDR